MIHPLSPDVTETADVLGAKAYGLIVLQRLWLPVPPGFVIDTRACRAFFEDGRLPDLGEAAADLKRPWAVRSGASVSMPGMMNTILNVDPPQLEDAVRAVFSSWNTPRAQTYRDLHGIPHDLGTAVTVQAMVFGDRDDHSGTGVAFSRDPNTGERVPFGEVLFRAQGPDVVSGTSMTRPLSDMDEREPAVWATLLDALERIEAHERDACYVEFTFESGKLWLLQMRTGGLTGRAAVRVAVDLVDEGVIDRAEALRRVTPQQLQHARTPRIMATDILARGLGACPGVATGRVAITADKAVRMASDGPVILVRPHTSPLDLHGLAAAAGVVTSLGGPASHAAVVARAMGKPAVVSAGDLDVGEGTLITIDGTGGEIVLGRAEVVTTDDPHLRRFLNGVDSAARLDP